MKRLLTGALALLIAATLLTACRSTLENQESKQPGEQTEESGGDAFPSDMTESDSETGTGTDTESEKQSETVSPDAFRSTGSFSSVTGTHLNLTVDWVAESTDGTNVTLTLTAALHCYSIDVGARPDMGKISVGEHTESFSTEALRHTEDTKTSFPFFTRNYTLSVDKDCTRSDDGAYLLPVTVSWPFNGVYGGKAVDTVSATSMLKFGK